VNGGRKESPGPSIALRGQKNPGEENRHSGGEREGVRNVGATKIEAQKDFPQPRRGEEEEKGSRQRDKDIFRLPSTIRGGAGLGIEEILSGFRRLTKIGGDLRLSRRKKIGRPYKKKMGEKRGSQGNKREFNAKKVL